MQEEIIGKLITSIREQSKFLEEASKPYRTAEKENTFNKLNAEDWCSSVFGDSLVKLRLFTENNFNYIESLGLVSVSRYIFEISIWLNLFVKDTRYGLVYYDQLIIGQQQYWTRLKDQMEREVIFLKSLGKQESEIMSLKMADISEFEDEDESILAAQSILKDVHSFIDEKASRKFSIYAEDAKTNGYDFQAYLIENKQIPVINSSISDIESERDEFKNSLSEDVKVLIKKGWKWNIKAEEVGLGDEYSFIYSFTSKLLHAVPTSITTNQKNLEPQEVIIFLKYIDIKLKDIVRLSFDFNSKLA